MRVSSLFTGFPTQPPIFSCEQKDDEPNDADNILLLHQSYKTPEPGDNTWWERDTDFWRRPVTVSTVNRHLSKNPNRNSFPLSRLFTHWVHTITRNSNGDASVFETRLSYLRVDPIDNACPPPFSPFHIKCILSLRIHINHYYQLQNVVKND